jgi:hypothetical protein
VAAIGLKSGIGQAKIALKRISGGKAQTESIKRKKKIMALSAAAAKRRKRRQRRRGEMAVA